MVNVEAKQYETFTDLLRDRASVITHPIACWLSKWNVHPNTVTIVGFLLTAGAGGVLALGRPSLGGALLLLTSSIDGLDGALARVTGKKSCFGAFLDSTVDRLSEGALLFGLLVWQLHMGHTLEVYLIFLSLLGAVMVSYTRARAEGVGYACKVGILTRVPRIFLLGAGLMLGLVRPTLTLLAVLCWVTVLQRILYVYHESEQTYLLNK